MTILRSLLCETPANKRNPDGVTEQTLMFLPPRRGCRPHQRNKQGLHPCLCSVRPFGTFSAPITAVAAPLVFSPFKESPRRSPLPSRKAPAALPSHQGEGLGVGSVISVPAPAFGHPAPTGVGSGCASYSGVTGVGSGSGLGSGVSPPSSGSSSEEPLRASTVFFR